MIYLNQTNSPNIQFILLCFVVRYKEKHIYFKLKTNPSDESIYTLQYTLIFLSSPKESIANFRSRLCAFSMAKLVKIGYVYQTFCVYYSLSVNSPRHSLQKY